MENKEQLLATGNQKLDWVAAHMPVLKAIEDRFKEEQPFKGLKLPYAFTWKLKPPIFVKCSRLAEPGVSRWQ